jgi:hypothetical protein
MPKSLKELYLDAYATVARAQHCRYGNPIGEAPDPTILLELLEQLKASEKITGHQARKICTALGKKAYGEVGLTPGTVGAALQKTLPERDNWKLRARIEGAALGVPF